MQRERVYYLLHSTSAWAASVARCGLEKVFIAGEIGARDVYCHRRSLEADIQSGLEELANGA